MFRTGILIITHNSADHIEACLSAIGCQRAAEDPVLVIDNASSDDTAKRVADHPSRPRLVTNATNAGFAGAANQGFELLQEDVDGVLLLNPDVVLKTPLQNLATACEQAGIAGGRLVSADGRPQIGFSFRRFPSPVTVFFETIGVNRMWKSNPVNRAYRCLDIDHDVESMVEQPAGAMLMIRKDVWRRLNGFDEQFFPVWFEDVDFCRRAALEGFHAVYVPSVEGIHEGGHSVLQIPNRSRSRYWYASLMRYSRKHFGGAGRVLVAAGVGAAKAIRSVGTMLRLHDGSAKEARRSDHIARAAFVYPDAESEARNLKVDVSADTANVRSRVLNEENPSKKNTERTLKRLHAR